MCLFKKLTVHRSTCHPIMTQYSDSEVYQSLSFHLSAGHYRKIHMLRTLMLQSLNVFISVILTGKNDPNTYLISSSNGLIKGEPLMVCVLTMWSSSNNWISSTDDRMLVPVSRYGIVISSIYKNTGFSKYDYKQN